MAVRIGGDPDGCELAGCRVEQIAQQAMGVRIPPDGNRRVAADHEHVAHAVCAQPDGEPVHGVAILDQSGREVRHHDVTCVA